MFNLQHWLDDYVSAVDAAFGARIEFIGLQGSYARGEEREDSDIDVVLILDKLTLEDLTLYREAIANLPQRQLMCGFVSGIAELKAWDRADLFQFYHDTKAIYGDLDFLAPLIKTDDIKRAVHLAACNIYHACVHNFVHEESAETLKGLYKAAAFALQARYYLQSGVYVSRKSALLPLLAGQDYEVLTCLAQQQTGVDLAKDTALLLEWSAALITEYGGEQNAEAED